MQDMWAGESEGDREGNEGAHHERNRRKKVGCMACAYAPFLQKLGGWWLSCPTVDQYIM
jgi:hypothetical protein